MYVKPLDKITSVTDAAGYAMSWLIFISITIFY